jgi:alkylation response protein AidB-like acyl-CoA dehydrogenase
MPEPIIPTVLGSAVLTLGASPAQQKAVLPGVAKGQTLLAVGYQEPRSRFDPRHVATRAEKRNDGWVLRGEKHQVLAGTAADSLIVSARTAGAEADAAGVTLFLVDASARGVSLQRQSLVDGRPAAIVHLDGVEVDRAAVVGAVDDGLNVLEQALDRATAALSAEMLGSMLAAFEMTLEYLKTRKQFGTLIGTFQALKHRAAIVYTETELSRSAAMAACFAIDANDVRVVELVSLAKARLSDAFVLTSNEAVQMHGGIGMTDEHDIGFFLKRARTAEMTFGDAAWHRRRYAGVKGY